MNDIKIPKEFTLFSQNIIVEFNNQRCSDSSALGITRDCVNKILLATASDNDELPNDTIEQTFLHEVVHQILYKMSEYDIAKNEKFVDLFSKLLHQFMKTAKY